MSGGVRDQILKHLAESAENRQKTTTPPDNPRKYPKRFLFPLGFPSLSFTSLQNLF